MATTAFVEKNYKEMENGYEVSFLGDIWDTRDLFVCGIAAAQIYNEFGLEVLDALDHLGAFGGLDTYAYLDL